MSTKRSETARKRFDRLGRVICSCGCGRRPPKGRKTWFSQACVDKWKEHHQPSHLRQLVWRRDRGVCAACGCDAPKRFAEFRKLFRAAFQALDRSFLFEGRKGTGWRAKRRKQVLILVKEVLGEAWRGWVPGRSTGWDADHLVAVAEGGGLCGLSNMQTLCHPCHGKKSQEMAARRRVTSTK